MSTLFFKWIKAHSMEKKETIILGGGISGLAAARFLIQNNLNDFLIIEKEFELGGLCRSRKLKNGFVFDTMPHLIFTNNGGVKKIFLEILGKKNYFKKERSAWIYSNNSHIRYPFEANTFGLPPDIRKECLIGLLKARYKKKNKKPKNFKEWIMANYGIGIANHFMLPYNEKQWAYDLNKMAHFDTGGNRAMLEIPLEDVIEGAFMERKKGFGDNSTFYYPKTDGIQYLIDKIAAPIKDDKIIRGDGVSKIFWRDKKILLQSKQFLSYDTLFYTLPLFRIKDLFFPKPPAAVLKATGKLRWNKLTVLHFEAEKLLVEDKMRIYYPENKFLFHRLSFPFLISRFNVLKGKYSFSAEISSSSAKKIPSGKTLIKTVINDLIKAGVINSRDDIRLAATDEIEPAYVIETPDTRKNVTLLCQFLKNRRIVPIGRFGQWAYFNMDHCLLSAQEAVKNLVKQR